MSNLGSIFKSETPQENPYNWIKDVIIFASADINFPVALESYSSKNAWKRPPSELPIDALSIIPERSSLSLIII